MKRNIGIGSIVVVIFVMIFGCAMDENLWRNVRERNTLQGYEEYLNKYPRGKYATEARKAHRAVLRFYSLSDTQIDEIARWQRAKDPKADQFKNIDRLLFTGASCLDKNANWTDRARGLKIYATLKGYTANSLTEAMIRVVLMNFNRRQVLFLVVKLGIPGTQEALNDLLLKHGNKLMAEDYLNAGSTKLHEGGAAWGRRHGYMVSSGFGSHRVRWGHF